MSILRLRAWDKRHLWDSARDLGYSYDRPCPVRVHEENWNFGTYRVADPRHGAGTLPIEHPFADDEKMKAKEALVILEAAMVAEGLVIPEKTQSSRHFVSVVNVLRQKHGLPDYKNSSFQRAITMVQKIAGLLTRNPGLTLGNALAVPVSHKKKKPNKAGISRTFVTPLPSVATDQFLRTPEWRRLRYDALKLYGCRCQCCGATPESGAVMNVDHIKPRKTHPHLALDIKNLQILCNDCNAGKGNRDSTDWRQIPQEIPSVDEQGESSHDPAS